MSDKKIVVPEGMIIVARKAYRNTPDNSDDPCETIIEAALRWLSENPIVPTEKQWNEAGVAVSQRYREKVGPSFNYHHSEICAEWQRRMFLAPELKIPDGVEDLMWSESLYSGDLRFHEAIPDINKNIVEAFRRGQMAPKESLIDTYQRLNPKDGGSR